MQFLEINFYVAAFVYGFLFIVLVIVLVDYIVAKVYYKTTGKNPPGMSDKIPLLNICLLDTTSENTADKDNKKKMRAITFLAFKNLCSFLSPGDGACLFTNSKEGAEEAKKLKWRIKEITVSEGVKNILEPQEEKKKKKKKKSEKDTDKKRKERKNKSEYDVLMLTVDSRYKNFYEAERAFEEFEGIKFAFDLSKESDCEYMKPQKSLKKIN